MSAKKICFDRVLPHEMNRPHRTFVSGGRLRAVFEFRKRWITGSTLTVAFMGGTSGQRDLVEEQAGWWTQHANLNFQFGRIQDMPDARIRIAFDGTDGAWSYVGTDALGIDSGEPTMNLGFLDRGTAAHEFGHAIGLGHEHQNPDGGILWNEAAVIADLSGPPNNWTVAQIRHNVLNKYSTDQIKGTQFDGDSIMLYAFPAAWTQNNISTRDNPTLSGLDAEFIASEEAYPGLVHKVEQLMVNGGAKAASIGAAGEEDVFTFEVGNSGRHAVETDGSTDVVMKLFGPNSETLLVAEDDDDGEGLNSRIEADLASGRYFVQVRHFNRAGGTGEYSVHVTR